jgi:hypothetical protein
VNVLNRHNELADAIDALRDDDQLRHKACTAEMVRLGFVLTQAAQDAGITAACLTRNGQILYK